MRDLPQVYTAESEKVLIASAKEPCPRFLSPTNSATKSTLRKGGRAGGEKRGGWGGVGWG